MRRITEEAEQDRDQQATQQHLHCDKMQRQGHDMEKFDEPYRGRQGNGIYNRKRLHEVLKKPLSRLEKGVR